MKIALMTGRARGIDRVIDRGIGSVLVLDRVRQDGWGAVCDRTRP